MAEYFPGINPDFSSLAEKPNNPEEDSKDKKDKKDGKKAKKSSFFERDKESSVEKKTDEKSEKKLKDKEPPLEALAPEEEQFVADKFVKARKQEVKDELETSTPDTTAEQEALVSATFLEALESEVENGTPVEEALDNAEVQTFDMAGFEAPKDIESETEINDNIEVQIDTDPELISNPTEKNDEENTSSPTPPSNITQQSNGSGGTVGGSGVAGGGGGSGAGGGSGHVGGGGVAGGGAGGLFPFGPGVAGARHGVLHTPAPEAAVPRERVGRYVLVGGIVGYLIGRRRGRIKTEKKLLPIQHKLEKQVTDLQQKIILREEKIRKITREQTTTHPEVSVRLIDRMQELQQLKNIKNKNTVEVISEYKRPEKIGKFAIITEQSKANSNSSHSERIKSVEQMPLNELLLFAENIKVYDTNLAKLFETNRLNDEGLRRIIKAYLSGERFEHIIQSNLISPEKYNSKESYPNNETSTPNRQSNIGGPIQKASQLEELIVKASHDLHTPISLQTFDATQPKSSKNASSFVMVGGAIAATILVLIFLVYR